jgi:FkbM family methyltransferase
VYYFGVWEPVISEWIYSLPLRGRTIVDIGAHCGWYSLMGARCVGIGGHVVAIEASPSTFAELTHNIALSGNDNIRPINAAAWNTVTELRLFPGGQGDAGKTTVVSEFADLKHTTKDVAANVTVSAAPLSSLLLPREVATAALIKIDVEGAEPEVVEGLADISQHLPEDVRFIIEVTPETLNTSNGARCDLFRFFKDRGYRSYVIENDYDTEFYLDAKRPVFAQSAQFEGKLTRQADLVFSRLPL